MATTAERLARNMDFSAFGKATELKQRLLFVIGALIIYRIGSYIPLPGVDASALKSVFDSQQGGLLGMFNMFSGGNLGRMTIFALGIMPYITMSIIMQLLSVMYPALAELKKEGPAGRAKITQYTRYGTVIMASFQALAISSAVQSGMGTGVSAVVIESEFLFRFTTIVSLVGGTMFLMWLGEQVTARGIGNGISLIIFAGIVAELPRAFAATFELGREGQISTFILLAILAMVVATFAFIVFMERAQRRIAVQYPKRQVGNRLTQGEQSHLPLKLNSANVIPPIFASSLLSFPMTLAQFKPELANADGIMGQTIAMLGPNKPLYIALFVALIVFFCFFYTKHVFNPADTAENLKKNGGFVPGYRPGKNTAEYLLKISTRLTVLGAIYLSLVCTVPTYFFTHYGIPLLLGGTSFVIIVNVVLDTVTQIQSHLFAHQYEGLMQRMSLGGKKEKKGKGKKR